MSRVRPALLRDHDPAACPVACYGLSSRPPRASPARDPADAAGRIPGRTAHETHEERSGCVSFLSFLTASLQEPLSRRPVGPSPLPMIGPGGTGTTPIHSRCPCPSPRRSTRTGSSDPSWKTSREHSEKCLRLLATGKGDEGEGRGEPRGTGAPAPLPRLRRRGADHLVHCPPGGAGRAFGRKRRSRFRPGTRRSKA